MHLYKSNQVQEKNILLKFSEEDLNLSSLYLKYPIKGIRTFLQQISLVEEKDINELLLHKQSIKTEARFIIFEDSTIIFNSIQSLDWKNIMLLFVVFSSVNLEEDLNKLQKFIRDRTFNLEYFNSLMLELRARYNTAYRTILNKQNYLQIFNLKEFQKAFRKVGVDVELLSESKLLVLTWRNIAIGNPERGQINYEKIVILINQQMMVDRYLLYFKNFYFNSLWNLPEITLHPNITTDFLNYGRNNLLEYLDHENYTMVAESFNEIVTTYNPDIALHSLPEIGKTLLYLRTIWEDNKGIMDLKIRSKKIFTEAGNVQKST